MGFSRWTDEVIVELKRLFDLGHSQGKCGALMGFTRNAIAGKLDRLGLKRGDSVSTIRLSTGSSVPRPRQRGLTETVIAYRIRTQPKRELLKLLAKIPNEITPLGVGIVDLERHHCKFPVDRSYGPMLYCGHKVVSGESWCPHHYRRVFRARPL